MLENFWAWYEKNYTLNIGIAASLFLIQIVHLIWLFGEVVWFKLTGQPLFTLTGLWKSVIVIIDYTEIPAIITTSIVYVNELRQRFNWKSIWYLVFINSQWLHLFWITDEFVLESFGLSSIFFNHANNSIHTPEGAYIVVLAWVAILIDYLEIPVIFDTLKKFYKSIKSGQVKTFLQEDLREQ